MHLVRANAILPFDVLGDADLTGMEGYFVKRDNATGRITLVTDDQDTPLGVILAGGAAPEKTSVAIGGAGLAGTVRVKLGADVGQGRPLRLRDDATVEVFTGAADTVLVGVALEAGVTGELIEAGLYTPVPF